MIIATCPIVLPNDTNQEVEYIYNFDDIFSMDDLPYDPPALPAGLAKRIYRYTIHIEWWWVDITKYIQLNPRT